MKRVEWCIHWVSVTPTATVLRRPCLLDAMRAKQAVIERWDLDQIGVRGDQVGLRGSPTIVAKVVDIVRDRPAATMLTGLDTQATTNRLIESLDRSSVAEQAPPAPSSAAPKKESEVAKAAAKPSRKLLHSIEAAF